MTQIFYDFLAAPRAPSHDPDAARMETLLRQLAGPYRRAARQARRVLARDFAVPRDRLTRLLASARYPHTRTQVLALLARGERVGSMVSLLNAAATTDDETVRRQASAHLADWGDRAAPDDLPRRGAFAAALANADRALPRHLARRLWASLGVTWDDPAPAGNPWRRRPVYLGPPVLDPPFYLSYRIVRRRYELTPRRSLRRLLLPFWL
ncbi:MAG TPA: hypothetical protein VH475_12260 [Tepidisphaeraceae bacterium]|jgi:hypothetical protein